MIARESTLAGNRVSLLIFYSPIFAQLNQNSNALKFQMLLIKNQMGKLAISM
jgi:hypothetical protein